MKDFLVDLAALNIVTVTGSYADGTQTEDSDIDFHVKEDRPDTPRDKRNIRKVVHLVEKHGYKWEGGIITGTISVGFDVRDIEIPIEFSTLFVHRPNRLKAVDIMGVMFKTW